MSGQLVRSLQEYGLWKRFIEAGAHIIATLNGDSYDRAGYDDLLLFLNSMVNTGAGTADVKLQDSPDDSVWTDVTDAVFVQVTTSNDDAGFVMSVDLRPLDKYVRCVAVIAAGTCDFGVTGILYNLHGEFPITQDETVVVA